MFITLTDFKDRHILINANHIKLVEPRPKGGSYILLEETVSVPVKEEVDKIHKDIIELKLGVHKLCFSL